MKSYYIYQWKNKKIWPSLSFIISVVFENILVKHFVKTLWLFLIDGPK